ncbi:hypothetical protein DPMN_132470 [Dreissena polymorpha]|uniref:Uncharacterized protein n=1 Tax=Dreissena polymorpha TaxID=45954 RepID=A0A9D4FSI6_DREPO|nr:hypothetical protein DPMN_132470 [Dreissena polymorpha]
MKRFPKVIIVPNINLLANSLKLKHNQGYKSTFRETTEKHHHSKVKSHVDIAADHCYYTNYFSFFHLKIPPPDIIDTPYGSRLVWRLPWGNQLVAHLKGKQKIRHRKRWSQVEYTTVILCGTSQVR